MNGRERSILEMSVSPSPRGIFLFSLRWHSVFELIHWVLTGFKKPKRLENHHRGTNLMFQIKWKHEKYHLKNVVRRFHTQQKQSTVHTSWKWTLGSSISYHFSFNFQSESKAIDFKPGSWLLIKIKGEMWTGKQKIYNSPSAARSCFESARDIIFYFMSSQFSSYHTWMVPHKEK